MSLFEYVVLIASIVLICVFAYYSYRAMKVTKKQDEDFQKWQQKMHDAEHKGFSE